MITGNFSGRGRGRRNFSKRTSAETQKQLEKLDEVSIDVIVTVHVSVMQCNAAYIITFLCIVKLYGAAVTLLQCSSA
jgi:hypothetical protein